MAHIRISRQALHRMPGYLQVLRCLHAAGKEFVTATDIAEVMHLNKIQVRKDIAAISRRPGKPMVGFSVAELLADISEFLAYENVKDAVLVGAGALGGALCRYSGFANYGMNIVAAFDANPQLVGTQIGGCKVYPMEELGHICTRLNIMVGVITVPDHAAQQVCDELCQSGVRAIWNFAPAHLTVPEDVILQNENLVVSLTVLSKRLAERLSNDIV